MTWFSHNAVRTWHALRLLTVYDMLVCGVDMHSACFCCMFIECLQRYALVDFFLDEWGMDINVRNASGMPACWFAGLFMSKEDGTHSAS